MISPQHCRGTAGSGLQQRAACHTAPFRPRVRSRLSVQATSTASKLQPDWTGDGMLSRLVNFMINTKPIYAVMKVLAKQAMKNTAEQQGVSWDGHVRALQADPELAQLKAELEDPSVQYPSYYLQPFHAYEDGNLNWLAACEVEPASAAIALRTFKAEGLGPEAAMAKMRGQITRSARDYHQQHGLPLPQTILDVGCSTGISTRWLQQEFPEADITGLDLSPYFLAVAELEERRRQPHSGKRIRYVHALAERSGIASSSLDFVAHNFIIHECPQRTICDLITEAKRVLKPRGVVCFVDNNPRSDTIQNLPPALFTLMKSTEPWSDEYYSFDLEAALQEAGFEQVVTVETDHRHRAVYGIRSN